MYDHTLFVVLCSTISLASLSFSKSFFKVVCVTMWCVHEGGVVYRPKKGGGSARFQHSARCASKWRRPNLHEASRTTRNPMLCYAGERLGVAFSVFLRGSDSSGSAVTSISGNTGCLTSETN